MTPERWREVRDLLAEALQLKQEDRPKYLDRACASDRELRREVDRLLSSSDAARSSFLESAPSHVTLSPGTKLGDYEVIGLLGAGGMGEVYRARDARLRRDVAIKVLPASLVNDAERLRRFEQEAQATAALNHPNILAVFQMGTYEGVPYLVSELLDGSTLREHLMRGPMPLRKVIDYGVQIARGLAAAHDNGVVHRDLKPENLFIMKDGRAKILDFGLAKLTYRKLAQAASVPTVSQGTDPGVVMGTVGYMAPEQVGGKPADHRADIFAFGAILYEALTGTRAFKKPTAAETMSAILNEEPPPASQIVAGVPPALQKVVHRCLEKDPAQRFQSASDLAFALESLSDFGAPSSVLAPPAKAARGWWYAAGAALVILAAALAVFLSRPRSSLVPATEWVQITNFADSVNSPALSPDGRMLTFLRGDDTFTTLGQVYVMLLPHGDPVRLTNDSIPKMSPVFSPDGSHIAYTSPWDTWRVPVLGGQAQLWLPKASGLSWIDAEHLMFSQETSGNYMELVSSDLSRGHQQSIYKPTPIVGMVHRSYVSPDRKWVIAVEMVGNLWKRCRLLPSDGSSSGQPIGPNDGVCTAAAWTPDGTWMYLNTNSGGAFHVWRQRFPDGKVEQVTSGPTEEEGIAFDPDGKSFVSAVGMRRSSVWLHDAKGERLLTSEATAALTDARNGSPFSPDGKKLYYVVNRTARREHRSDAAIGELWELDLESGTTQVMLPGFSVADFSISPGGRDMVFTAFDEEGIPSIWLMPLDRSSSPHILQKAAQRPRFTTDWIYYVKRSPEGFHVHRIHIDGSGDEQIWNEAVVALATSPDGRYLAVLLPLTRDGIWKLEVVDWARKRVQPVCTDAIGYWSDDGRSFIVNGGIGKRNAGASTYVITLPAGSGVPELPPNGLSSASQLAELKHARVVGPHVIAPSRTLDTYAYVKETVQRNLYRIPLH
jgi:Tol biopolymer transport system component